MPVVTYYTNPVDELDGLKDAITAATTGVIVRAPTVRNRDVTGFFDGPWPLITIRYADYRLEYISGGQPYLTGQDLRAPSLYSVEMEDVVTPDSSAASEVVAASQTDLLRLIAAIEAYFDHLPHRCLPDGSGNPRAKLAGLPIRFRGIRPFADKQGGDIRVVFAGVIGVVGLPRPGSAT